MEYFTTTSSAARRGGGCLVVGIYEKGEPGRAASDIDSASGGAIKRLIKSGDLSANVGDARVLTGLSNVRAQRVVVAGLGPREKFGVPAFRQALEASLSALKGSRTEDVTNYLTLEDAGPANAYYLARFTVETIGNGLYSFTAMKSSRRKSAIPLKKIGLALKAAGDRAAVEKGAEHADAIVRATSLAKDLGNLPANVCTPAYLARTAQRLAREDARLQTRVLGESEMKRLGMHSLLSVTRGTDEPAKLIVMQYKGAGRQNPIVLVGKGITFDTGGISLKPGPGMDEMKFDMSGA
ncbi:MAG TPA: M17 family peptidase N-terminal domain-containing protein, partial [Woeseiaceae bacterium]|nr:M17 family peptidase N-terminal domain-containing protein [Woeseiaceae bacterium]